MLDENIEAFAQYVSFLRSKMRIHSARKTQLALLLTKDITILIKQLDFPDIFLEKLANIFPEQIGANEHKIKLEKGKQPPYRPIHSLGLVEFESLKTYINTNLVNGFIQASMSPLDAPIVFVCKLDGNFCLCVNYQVLNNLIIKNWYLLPLIGKSVN